VDTHMGHAGYVNNGGAPREGGTALTLSAALMERALVGDGSGAAELLRRLAAGDTQLAAAVARPDDPEAERVRRGIVQFLALGTWLGHALPLPRGYHAGRDGQHLRDLVAQAACSGPPRGWQATLVELLLDPDPLIRQMAATLLGQCSGHLVLTALVAALGDRDESVRWAAATTLARRDAAGAEALLRRLASRDLVPEMRRVAAHVLRHCHDVTLRQTVAPVVQALDGSDYQVTTPVAAAAALRALGERQPGT
jgi:hypothetical protein